MNNDYADDPVYLDDVAMAARNCRENPDAEHRAYRNRLIRQCYDQGNVTLRELAAAADLTKSTIHAIRRAGRRPWPRPKLRIVR